MFKWFRCRGSADSDGLLVYRNEVWNVGPFQWIYETRRISGGFIWLSINCRIIPNMMREGQFHTLLIVFAAVIWCARGHDFKFSGIHLGEIIGLWCFDNCPMYCIGVHASTCMKSFLFAGTCYKLVLVYKMVITWLWSLTICNFYRE